MEYSGQEEQDVVPEEHIRSKLEWWCWKLGQTHKTWVGYHFAKNGPKVLKLQ